MKEKYNYEKFTEWLLLKKYSPQTVTSIIRVVEYFREWAATENIFELKKSVTRML